MHGNIPKKEMYRRKGKESLMPIATCYILGNIPFKEGFESEGVCLFLKNPKERTKQREHLNNEVASMDKLLKEVSINENTHARYRLSEMIYAEKRLVTREKYGFTN